MGIRVSYLPAPQAVKDRNVQLSRAVTYNHESLLIYSLLTA